MIELGQLRQWTVGVNQGDPFVILEYSPGGAGAWWVLTPKGRDWEPNEMIEEFSEVVVEAR
jgi:hypothetical protein